MRTASVVGVVDDGDAAVGTVVAAVVGAVGAGDAETVVDDVDGRDATVVGVDPVGDDDGPTDAAAPGAGPSQPTRGWTAARSAAMRG